MAEFILSTDSCCDVPPEQLARRGIAGIPLTFITEWNGKLQERKDDFIGDAGQLNEFYADVSGGMVAKTSQLTVHDHLEYFRGLLEREAKDVVHITLSSGLSGTYDQAVLASKMLLEEFPAFRVHIVDSLGATAGQRLLVDEGERLAKSGTAAQEAAERLRESAQRLHHWIVIDDLNHLKRGGRIGGAAAAVGTLLNIKPFLCIDGEGRLAILDKLRGMKKAVSRVVRMAEKYAAEGRIYVVHAAAPEAAEELRSALVDNTDCEVPVMPMGPVIGAHVGPGMVGAAFFGKERVQR